jgi:alpha-2-macroglobulin
MKRGMLTFLKSQVGLWAWKLDRTDLVQAYALYDLALAGEPELGAMNRMREKKGLDDEARFKLAAAYAFAGQKQEAQRLTRGDIPPLTPYTEMGGTYGSQLRDTAMLAEGYLETGSIEEAAPLVNEVAKLLSDDEGYNTQATAYGLLVVGKYLSAWKTGQPMKLTYTWGGKSQSMESDAPVKRLTLPPGEGTAARPLTLVNASAEPVYVRVLRTGQPAPGKEKPVSNGLKLAVSYTDKDGAPLDVGSLAQGTDIIAKITVTNPTNRSYEELAMAYLAPAGWEISNPRFEGWSQDSEKGFEYQDVRDDRVYTFFSLAGGKGKTLKLMLNASYIGKYYLPPTKVEAMYDSSINAAAEGRWITVNDASSPASGR